MVFEGRRQDGLGTCRRGGPHHGCEVGGSQDCPWHELLVQWLTAFILVPEEKCVQVEVKALAGGISGT